MREGPRPASLELPFIRILGKEEANLRWPEVGLHLEMIGATYVGSSPSGTTSKAFTDALLKINGQPHPVPKFQTQAFIVAAAPKDSNVRLEITDTDRTQWIDLRTAETSTPIPGLYPERRDHASIRCNIASPDKAIDGSSAVLMTDAVLDPWVDTRGWAKSGRVWMTVELNLWYSRNGIAIALDTAASITLTGPEGPIPVTVPLSLGGPNQDDPHIGRAELTADVPAEIQTAQLTLQLKGTITVAGRAVPKWTPTCETVRDALAFNK
ncbi:hypothetical protein GCM10007977_046630 [Dactylosporangium sucinum]|uniref:Uncharacterized protein n=1 Tax=Dactylosporangium sucinum TaxID=1424081 RepID=A0A917TW89_9ACTN|nr:hypothetical protein GCM10007977_046630 [Dactylosporangium sucinum]